MTLRFPACLNVILRRALCVGAGEMGKKGAFFYAVRRGLRPGVYGTWPECKDQVDKFPNAVYKKFACEADAWSFVRSRSAETPAASEYEAPPPRNVPDSSSAFPLGGKRSRAEEEEEEERGAWSLKRAKSCDPPRLQNTGADGFTYMGDAVVVYTDGCCSANGKKGARAGIGVYWGRDHPCNVADRLPGRQTNQRAELNAACRALEQAREMNLKKLVLYTDSKFTINGVTSWVKTWKSNGWRLKGGGVVVNKEDFQRLDQLNAELEVVWMHVPGHAGYTGNEEADRLSREGAAKPPC